MQYSETTIGKHKIAFGEQGTGEPLLLLPGLTMSIQRWVGAGYVDKLAQTRRVIAIDPLGHGNSSRSSDIDDYASDRIVERIMAVLDSLDVANTTVWGYSRGAQIGTFLALQEPERVRSLIYGGNILFGLAAIRSLLGDQPSDEEIQRRHQSSLDGDWSAYWDNFPVPLPEALMADIESRNDLGSISAAHIAMGRLTPWEAAPGIPTLAMWGSGEVFHDLNVSAAAEFGPAQSAVEVAILQGGHAEAFNDHVPAIGHAEAFISRLGS